MDWMTPLGYLVGFSTILYVLVRGQSVGLIFNAHALILVYGGTLGSTLLTYPTNVIAQAIRAVRIFLWPGDRPATAPSRRMKHDHVREKRADARPAFPTLLHGGFACLIGHVAQAVIVLPADGAGATDGDV